ncbi:hypothetical protein BD293_3941 [Roseinatronobacter monicus]|uniref:Uncharacterized protein n=1 Tax=Roseinatronobacter monicus TaxID=393481 RepID=A0A543K4M9_9RHOB|nr:hypothetical protein BD293_3941 [Roseinatronobacter monicus]
MSMGLNIEGALGAHAGFGTLNKAQLTGSRVVTRSSDRPIVVGQDEHDAPAQLSRTGTHALRSILCPECR